MAEVPGAPYEPFPTAQPTERPIQLRGVPAPEAAFGVNIANAVRTFGGDVESTGKELSDRAFALRQLQVEGKLRDLTTQYYNEVSPVQDSFLTAQGDNASTDALNAHNAQIEQIRQKYAGMAQQYGPYGVNQFGSEAASLQRSFIRESTEHSASETRKATDTSIDARIGTIKEAMGRATTDAQITDFQNQITNLENSRRGLWGYDQSVADFKTHQNISGGLAENVRVSLTKNPEDGIKKAQAAIDSGRLTGEDQDNTIKRVNAAVPTAVHQHLMRIYQGNSLDLGNNKYDPDRLVDVTYQLEGHGRGPYIWNRRSAYYGQQALPGGVMPGNLQPWLKEAGMPAMTEEQYINSPDAQRQLMRFKLNQFQEQTGSANGAFSMWFTGHPLTPRSLGLHDQNITNQVYLQRANQFLARSATEGQIADAAENYGRSLSTNITPDAPEIAREYAMGHTAAIKDQQRRAIFDVHQQFDQWIEQNPNKSWDDFQRDPNTQALLNQANEIQPDYVRQWPSIINGHNRAIQDQTNINHYHDLIVMSQDDPEKFMQQSVWDDHQLNETAKKALVGEQRRLFNAGHPDVTFQRAFTDLSQSHSGEVPDKTRDPEGYVAYKGGLYDALQAYQEHYKAPLRMGTPEGNKALDEIHKVLMSKFKGTPAYLTTKTPDDFYKAAKTLDPNVTDEQIHYQWLKDQIISDFQRLYAQPELHRAAAYEAFRTDKYPTAKIVTQPLPPPARRYGARGEIGARPYPPSAFPSWEQIVGALGTQTEGQAIPPEAIQHFSDYYAKLAQTAREAEERRQMRLGQAKAP